MTDATDKTKRKLNFNYIKMIARLIDKKKSIII